jgi:hypothetical protein
MTRLNSRQIFCHQPSAGGRTIGIGTWDLGVRCSGKPKYSPVTIGRS